jgi:uncharacterized iron-regulated membrane protein
MSEKGSINWKRLNRKIHYWGSIIIALPLLIVLLSGLLLQVKKQVTWVQPPTAKGVGRTPELSFERILAVAATVPEAGISTWKDVDRLDVRPKKGIVKVRAKNSWEVQIDNKTGDVLQVAYRRSDVIEGLHDGSFFHDAAKLWLFLPAAVILLVIWGTGIYLFFIPILSKRKKKAREASMAERTHLERTAAES